MTMVMGMLADKDAAACGALLAPLCAHIVCCTPENPRPWRRRTWRPCCGPAAPMWRRCRALHPALDRALQKAEGGPLLVAGSFYVSSLLRPRLTAFAQNRQKP